MDEGHKLTDKKLEKLIRKLDKVYSQAAKETEAKLNDYMRRFKVKDAIKQRQVKTGEISHEEWINWRTGQIAVGQRWEEMRNSLAKDLTNVDKIAVQMMGESMHDVYALNHNFGTFEVEKGSLIDTSYTLYDKHTVENLVKKYAKTVKKKKNITPHKLRSTYGTNLYNETGDIYLVADVLGHKDVNTTKKHYASLEDSRRRMAAKAVILREKQ